MLSKTHSVEAELAGEINESGIYEYIVDLSEADRKDRLAI
jgi:hypothetical protein